MRGYCNIKIYIMFHSHIDSPKGWGAAGKKRRVDFALKALTANWAVGRFGHRCTKAADGSWCCLSIGEAKLKVKEGIMLLNFACMPPVICLQRWLTSFPNTSFWMLGTAVHNMFPRGWLNAFAAESARRHRAIALEPPPEDDAEQEDASLARGDNFSVKLTKRLGGSCRFWSRSNVGHAFLFPLVHLQPLHSLMCSCVKSAKAPFSPEASKTISEIADAVNQCQYAYWEMLSTNVLEVPAFRVLEGVFDVSSQEPNCLAAAYP
jgi:hypothetical protein